MVIYKATLKECNNTIEYLNSVLNFPDNKGTLTTATPRQFEESEFYWFAVDKSYIFNELRDEDLKRVINYEDKENIDK